MSQQLPTPSTSQDSLAYAIPISVLGERFNSLFCNNLPPREVCQLFFEGFLQRIHPIIPVCHVPTLKREYADFMSNLSPDSSAKTLALVLAVLYTGAATSGPVNKSYSDAIYEIYERIFSLVDFASYHVRNTPASIRFLQSYIIMDTFRASQFAPFFAFGSLPQAIRFAQSLRLHLDQKKGSPVEIEVKRRIWWHLVFIDIESTIATGLPPIIHRTGYTTQLTSLAKDDALSSVTEIGHSPQPREFSLMMIAMQGSYQWAHRMQAWFETLPSHEEVGSFKSLIENLMELIPDIPDEENQWARTYLKMQIDRGYCMLGLRFWQPDQYKGIGCHSEVVR